MPDGYTILVTDRNRHVRNFLCRELADEGYQVKIAKDGRDVMRRLSSSESPDLLILDLEMSCGEGLEVLKRLQRSKPHLPVVIHTFLTEYESHPVVQSAAAFVNKKGNTDCLKAAVSKVLKRFYPERSQSEKEEGLEAKHR